MFFCIWVGYCKQDCDFVDLGGGDELFVVVYVVICVGFDCF